MDQLQVFRVVTDGNSTVEYLKDKQEIELKFTWYNGGRAIFYIPVVSNAEVSLDKYDEIEGFTGKYRRCDQKEYNSFEIYIKHGKLFVCEKHWGGMNYLFDDATLNLFRKFCRVFRENHHYPR